MFPYKIHTRETKDMPDASTKRDFKQELQRFSRMQGRAALSAGMEWEGSQLVGGWHVRGEHGRVALGCGFQGVGCRV